MLRRPDEAQHHFRYRFETVCQGFFAYQVASEKHTQRVLVGNIGKAESGDGDVEVERVDIPAKQAHGFAPVEDRLDLVQNGTVACRHIARGAQINGLVQVLGVDHSHESG